MASTHGGVQIDELNQRERGEARDPFFEVIKFKRLAFALHELDDLSTHEID